MNRKEEIEARLAAIRLEADAPGADLDALTEEVRSLKEEQRHIEEAAENRRKQREAVAKGTGTLIGSFDGPGGGFVRSGVYRKMKEGKEMGGSMEIRSFQKYVAEGSIVNMSVEERAGLVTSGAGAVMPVDIFERMITSGKYSDLLSRATVMNLTGAGTVKVPVASGTAATWKTELQPVDPTAPTLTSLDLGGKELMRAIQYSAAVEHMTAEQFTDWMADLCASEVVETLEAAFITATEGTDAPHNGLQKLTWTPNANEIEATGEITAADVAKGLSLLPQKYARNAILLMNANTAYNPWACSKALANMLIALPTAQPAS